MKSSKPFKISSIFFWSVISAAFIGPGTVTTALKSGSAFQGQLLWAIVFSTLACYILQEAASRMTIATGKELPDMIEAIFPKWSLNIGAWLSGSVIFGCIAYQAGNMVGAMEGIQLSVNIPDWIIISMIYFFAVMVLWSGKIKAITRILGLIVLIMALIFFMLVFSSGIFNDKLFIHMLIPQIPHNSSLYIIGLIGTTIVPYNLFLGSGLSNARKLDDTRYGLFYAILIGGIITIFILLSGTLITGSFSFENISKTLEFRLGSWASTGFALGLFAAGISSSITAPLAAAITGKRLYSKRKNSKKYFRIIWLGVLTSGAIFAFLDIDPVFLIITAQALNGLILPLVAVSLYILLNNRILIPSDLRNSRLYNIITLLVIGTAVFLGLFHFFNVMAKFLSVEFLFEHVLIISGLFTLLIIMVLMVFSFKKR